MEKIEQPFSDWQRWFSENRSTEYSVLTTLDKEPDAFPTLTRIFTPQDGRKPKAGVSIQGSIWEIRNTEPKDGLIVLFSEGKAPLVLAPPEYIPSLPVVKKEETRKLTPPYLWRCRVCSTTGQSEKLGKHCGVNVRQLSRVSDESTNWLQNFLDGKTFSFVSPAKLKNLPGMIHTPEKIDLAIEAGMELERMLSEIRISCPDVFEVYNMQTDHLRVSDLKIKDNKRGRGFQPALASCLRYADKPLPTVKKVPSGGLIEIGHVFDELMADITNTFESELWNKGTRVMFECTEMGIRVSGTPDLEYNGIPVEMKTTRALPIKDEPELEKFSTQKSKWKNNYLPQLAMYSDACGMDWMLLLLISRETGKFSLIPVDARDKLESLRKDWKKWTKDRKLMTKLGKYLEINPHLKIN